MAAMSVTLAVALSACGLSSAQKDALSTFGAATSTYADTVAKVASDARTDVITLEGDSIGHASLGADTAFRNDFQDDPDHPDQYGKLFQRRVQLSLTADHIRMTADLAAGLKQYGKALQDLVAYGDPAARSKTISDIASQMNAVFNSPVAGSTAAAVGASLGFVTNEALEEIKKGEIGKIVLSFKPAVDSASTLLAVEFDGKQIQTIFYSYKKALDDFRDRLPKPHDKEWIAREAAIDHWRKGTGSYQEYWAATQARARYVEAWTEWQNQFQRYTDLQSQTLAATKSLRTANDKLVEAIKNDTLSIQDIEAFAQDAVKLYQTATSGKKG